MKETRTIVPVQPIDSQTSNCQETHSNSRQIACHLTLNGAEIQFYNGVDKHILHAVLAEVRNAR